MTGWPLTRRGTGLLVGALAAWALGRLFGVPELAMAAVAIVALVALALLTTRALSTRLSIRRRVAPVHLHIDTRGEVEVVVHNEGRLPTAALRLDDQCSPLLTTTSRFTTRPLGAGETVRLRYPLVARRRGTYAIGPTRVELRDPFGVARRPAVVGGTDDVVIYPRVLALADGPPLAGHLGTGADGPPRPGPAGDELATIREYVQGDDLRRVHWRSTAHRGRLMVRQEENRQRPEAVLVVDTGIARHVVTAGDSSFETMLTATASILWLLRARDFRVRLVDGPVVGAPRPEPWERTMTRLASSDPGVLDMAGVWGQLERGAAGEGTLVAVVPTPDPALLRQMVRAGRTFGARVALLVDPPTAPRSQAFTRHDAGTAAAALRAAGWFATVVESEDAIPSRWGELTTRGRGTSGRTPAAGVAP